MRFALRANDVPLLQQCRTDDFEWLPFRSSHIQRKNYFKLEQCRAACGLSGIAFSRGGVVEESGICSAGFLRKLPRCGERPHPLRHGLCRATSFPFLSLTRHLLPSLLPMVTFLPGAGRICPDQGKMSPQVTKRGIWHRAAMTERAGPLAERARSVKCASTVSGLRPHW